MIHGQLTEEIIRWMVDDIQTHPEEAGSFGLERWRNVLKYEVFYRLIYYSGCTIYELSVHEFNNEADLLPTWIPQDDEWKNFIKSIEEKVTKRVQNEIR